MDVQLFFKNMTDYITALSSIERFFCCLRKKRKEKRKSFT